VRADLGARPSGPAAATAFTVWAPQAETVEVRSRGESVVLARGTDGYHHGSAPWGPGALYHYTLDGGPELPDPASRAQPQGVHGPSQVVDLTFPWSDEAFRPGPLQEWILYELHIGTFTEEGTFAAAVAELDDLVELGVTAVEIMPVAQFPGLRNWGYDGVFPFAVQDSYGGPSGLQGFVDECHRRNLAVVLDVVYNHLGPEGNVLDQFAPYFTDRYSTPWGPAVNLDGPFSDDVRAYFLANARQWFEDFHVDALRLDAVHELIDRSARPFLAELSAVVEELASHIGRSCVLIAESADNNPLMVTARSSHGLGMQAQWNDDFHHSVHALLTAERDGYYGDYGRVGDVARAMSQGFVYQGQYSAFRKRRHGAPSIGLPPERFAIFIQNHDQVGNRPDGARLSTLVPPDRLRLAAALLLLSPGLPLLFMGEEYGEVAPFAYFVDHEDPGLLKAVRRGRAAEHAHDPGGPLPDPGDPATFTASTLRRDRGTDPPQAELRQLYRDLIALRRREPALHNSSRENTLAHAEGSVVTLTRTHGETSVAVFFNLSSTAESGQLPAGERWDEVLRTQPGDLTAGTFALDPWGFRVFCAGSPCELRESP
jgi:maltooligosyltrehalose trehalohydrolase